MGSGLAYSALVTGLPLPSLLRTAWAGADAVRQAFSKPVTISSRERTYFVASGVHLKVATPNS
jgi:hypothetical protein